MAETLPTSPPPTNPQDPPPIPPPPPSCAAATAAAKAASLRSPTAPVGTISTSPERQTFSQLLAGAMASGNSPGSPRSVVSNSIPCFVASQGFLEPPRFSGQFGMSHQEALASVTAQAQMQLRAGNIPRSQSLSLQSISSPSTVSPLEKPNNSEEKVITQEADSLHVPDQKLRANLSFSRITATDGYNWRKYGQKQVKASENSRSYYRCTHSNCPAKKKVEHHQDGRISDVTYQGEHSHGPPQKVKSPKERVHQGSHTSEPLKDDRNVNLENRVIKRRLSSNNSDSIREKSEELHYTSDCEEPITTTEGIICEIPYSKQRLCEVPVAYIPSLFKAAREAKLVVQNSCIQGPANDGYRWRKYGQKNVKGSPNPRSYYKCTYTGCPVRKHVERAEDAKNVMITYEGHHNHDIPPPPAKNCSDAPAPVTSDEQMQTLNSVDKTPSSECKKPNNVESTCNGAVESQVKQLDSANLPSRSEPISNTNDKNGGNNSDIQRQLLDGSPPTVPVQNS